VIAVARYLWFCEGPTHGSAVSGLLCPDGDLGQIWRVPRGVVYRSLDPALGARPDPLGGEEPSRQGPVRLLVEATR